jgi:D-aminopeptidase
LARLRDLRHNSAKVVFLLKGCVFMPRLRELGVTPGRLPTGPLNAITDVPGVRVGHTTLTHGEGKYVEGVGPVRTGCTAIVPHSGNLFRDKVNAAVHTINGFGKANGFEQIRERGTIESPILLCNTLNVGQVADALTAYMLRDNPDIGLSLAAGTLCPTVGECNDGFLSDLRGRHIKQEHVFQAIETASGGPVAEGNVGAGNGTACYQFKGGIGTASRVALGRFTIGALVQTNMGNREELMMLGAPIGQHFLDSHMPHTPPGSIMMVLATDAPLTSRQLTRLAVRAGFGLARTGTVSHDGSGDFVIAFSTSLRRPHYTDEITRQVEVFNERGKDINELFLGVVESIEEAILNALCMAQTMQGRDGNVLHSLPIDKLIALFDHYHIRGRKERNANHDPFYSMEQPE